MQRCRCAFQARLLHLLAAVTCCLVPNSLAASFRGVIEGDTAVSLYVNSIPLYPDLGFPILPLNGVRQVLAADSPGFTVRIDTGVFAAGDVLAIEVQSTRSEEEPHVNALGEISTYDGLAGFIAAFQDGTMTSQEWKCTTQEFDLWHSPTFNMDGSWTAAREQSPDCCPWRDNEEYWGRLNAKWIGPSVAGPGPRRFFCRYTVPESRLPVSETQYASILSPNITMVGYQMGQSVSMVSFMVNEAAQVACGVIDPRFFLRVPTALELLNWGTSKYCEPFEDAWDLVGYRTDFGYTNITALQWLDVAVIEQCQDACWASAACRFMTFYEDGSVNPQTGNNCKLMAEWDSNLTDTAPQPGVLMTHYRIASTAIVHDIAILGLLTPGTLYYVYCATQHPDGPPNPHSTWDEVAATEAAERTEGCVDCGALNMPSFRMYGGYADATAIIVLLASDRPGRLFCTSVPGMGADALTGEEIKEQETFNIVTLADVAVPVIIGGLQNGTQYEVFCTAESDGGILSPANQIEDGRRPWRTEALDVTIESMSLNLLETVASKAIEIIISVEEESDVVCMTLNASDARDTGVPNLEEMLELGVKQRVKPPEILQGVLDVPLNSTSEAYCSAYPNNSTEDDDAGFNSPFPIATVEYGEVDFNTIRTYVRVDRGPSGIFCLPLMWADQPVTIRPQPPTQEDMFSSPYGAAIFADIGGVVMIEMRRLATGAIYDVYCYAEEYTPPTPPGALPPPRMGMDVPAIRETRRTYRTDGPYFNEGGWHCVVGDPCNISGIDGGVRSNRDRLQARLDQCPSDCQCGGIEDVDRKGAECLDVSQNRNVAAPVPGTEPEVRDPRGAWCYVPADTLCGDVEPSVNFDGFYVSYLACTYEAEIGLPGSGPPGFPREGIASPIDSYGDAFGWSRAPLYTAGAAYELCWCNGTASECEFELNFHMKIGLLHVSGPTAAQMNRTMDCLAGSACSFDFYEGHALADGSRLAVLPDGPMGCAHEKITIYDPEPVPGFPQLGVSSPATDFGASYSWGVYPVQSGGGVFLLCFCGKLAADGTTDCPAERPDGGGGFLAPGGYLRVTGPYKHTASWKMNCSIGVTCTMRNIGGLNLRGGDFVGVFRTCGEAAPPPPGWMLADQIPEGWEAGGWMEYGPEMTQEELIGIGAPIPEVTEAYFDNTLPARGVFGFPNQGASQPDPLPAHYPFVLPIWAFSGDYMLCWCAGSHGVDCENPLFFAAPIGVLRVLGPAVLPSSHQTFNCIRGGRCEIQFLEGTQLVGSQIFIAEDYCGGPPPSGAPNRGFSQPSPDGHFFKFSSDGMTSPPGMYLLCWCAVLGNCYTEADYGSFVGTLRLKGPLSPPQDFVCYMRASCNVTGIYGEGLTNEDSLMILTVCGYGAAPSGWTGGAFSTQTLDGGAIYTLPPATVSGNWRACWCPGESICASSVDFFLDLGTVWVTGPDPAALYECHEWVPCSIENFVGMWLEDGNRIRVVPFGLDCTTGVHTAPIPGLPQDGVANPAIDGGRTYSFGDDVVLAAVDRYYLCWCEGDPNITFNASNPNMTGFCGDSGTFLVQAGILTILSYRDYQFQTRPEDPEPRDNDFLWVYVLAIPLPCLFCAAIVVGWQKLSGRQGKDVEAPPLFKPRKAWAALAQEKAKNDFSVKQVMETRIKVQEHKKRSTSREIVVKSHDIPSFKKEPLRIIGLEDEDPDVEAPEQENTLNVIEEGSGGSTTETGSAGGPNMFQAKASDETFAERQAKAERLRATALAEARVAAIENARLGIPMPEMFAPPPPRKDYKPDSWVWAELDKPSPFQRPFPR